MIRKIKSELTDKERRFLLSFKKGEPEWDLLDLQNIEKLPGPQWKLLNIKKMDKKKHAVAVCRLKDVLEM